MKPVTYYIQTNQINALVERFGSHLEQLDRSQTIQVRVLLTSFLMGQDQMGADYTICDAWQDSSLHLLVEDEVVVEVADLLDGLTISQAEGLLSILQEQCTSGNARLKTPVETTTNDLMKHGVPQELASTAAIIIREVDAVRDRTPEEQATINQIHQFITR